MVAITVALIFDYPWFKYKLLLLCGDVEFNPGPKQNTWPKQNLVSSDHPWNKKRGDVCLCYKSILPIRIIDINYSNECVSFELIVGDKIFNFIALYRSPSQLQDLLESFKENLELNLEPAVQNNPFLIILLDDFNAKSSNWCKNDIATTKGKARENISSQFGLHQMINEPTHTL